MIITLSLSVRFLNRFAPLYLFFGIKSTKQDSYLICFEVVLGASQVILIASSNLCTTMEQLVHKTYVQIDNSILQLNNIHRCNVSNLYYIATYVVSLFL